MAIFRSKPAPMADNFLGGAPSRAGRYGEAYNLDVNPTSKHTISDEGSYFVLTNPTPGTAVASAVNASSDFTKSLFIFKNTAPVGGLRCYLDYLKILPTVAPASATSMQVAVQVDTIARYTSGGTGPVSGVNVNGDDSTASVGQVYYTSGAAVLTTAAASTNARLVGRAQPRNVIPAVLDTIVVSFGTSADIGSSSGTAAGRSGDSLAPVVVGGGQSAVFNIWFPSNALTGISFEFELAWWER